MTTLTKKRTKTTWRDLPPELAIEILSRVPLSKIPLLSTTSKTLDGYVKSRAIYKHWSKISRSEPVLHVSLSEYLHQSRWFLLSKKPLEKEFILRPLPAFSPIPMSLMNSFVGIGSRIFSIGGSEILVGKWRIYGRRMCLVRRDKFGMRKLRLKDVKKERFGGP
ncbi:unnamed protein product [Arabis nemorensis]|uniref:F-box domain-containing protein n=1 Tax=Arabis nemorensis TaxID=586526 RepID=A0A565C9G4_9BRAS|nr:unnamed protein product [Arabis nemorensis]